MFKKLYWIVILTLALTAGVIFYMNVSSEQEWENYINREPRTLRIQLAAPYDQIVYVSGLDTFANMTWASNDNNDSFSMTPWEEPDKSPVKVSYGFPKPVFELPPSTFVSVIFEAGHASYILVIPMIKPVKREEALQQARGLLGILNAAPLKKIKKDNLSLDEVRRQMARTVAKMDSSSFEIGQWRREEPHGNTDFVLSIKVVSDSAEGRKVEDQLYSLELVISSFDGKLSKKLEMLRLKARTKIRLMDNNKPCTSDSYDCDIPDVRKYLDVLRKQKMIPFRVN